MTPPRAPARPLPWIFAALIGAVALMPPETYGIALAGTAGLALLAALLVALSDALPARAWMHAALAGALAVAARFAEASGPAVLPVALAVLALAWGIAARAGASSGLRVGRAASGTLAAAGAFVGGRAVYEVVYGLRALAARVHADAASIPDADLVLGRLAQGRAYAGFPTPAAAGGFLALALAVTAGLGLAASGRRRAVLGAAATLQAAGLLATRSLTAAAALLLAVGAAALLLRSRRAALAAAAIVATVGLLAALRAGQVLSTATDDSPWALRFGNARIGVAIAADHPWSGVGPGGYAEALPRYRGAGDNEARHAHSLPVELVAELGVPLGLVATAAILALFLGPMGKLRERDPVERGIAIGLAAFAIHNLADFTAFLPAVLLPAVVLRGTWRPPPPSGSTPPLQRAAFLTATALAAGIVALSGLADATIDDATLAAREGRIDDAARASRRALRLAPWSAEAALVAAQAEAAAGRLDEARRAADRAVALAPRRASAREVRARVRSAGGDAPGAYADLVHAAALHPSRPKYAEARDRAFESLP